MFERHNPSRRAFLRR